MSKLHFCCWRDGLFIKNFLGYYEQHYAVVLNLITGCWNNIHFSLAISTSTEAGSADGIDETDATLFSQPALAERSTVEAPDTTTTTTVTTAAAAAMATKTKSRDDDDDDVDNDAEKCSNGVVSVGDVVVELVGQDLWKKFHKLGTEMIITKAGR